MRPLFLNGHDAYAQDRRSSLEHKLRYFWPSIDSNESEMFPGPEKL